MGFDLERRFEFLPGLCRTLKAVGGSCQVRQAVKPLTQSHAGNVDWTPLPDVSMEIAAMDKFAMPPARHGKEVYHGVHTPRQTPQRIPCGCARTG